MFDQVFAVDQAAVLEDLELLHVRLTGKRLGGRGGRGAMADEDLSGPATCLEAIFHLGEGDQLLDYTLQFLSAAKRSVHVPVPDELALEICEQVLSLVARQAKFTSINKVSHT